MIQRGYSLALAVSVCPERSAGRELVALLFRYFVTFIMYYMSPVKRICVFEHSVMTNFNCACPAIQRGLGSGFLSEGSF